jgi:hypothetical protein
MFDAADDDLGAFVRAPVMARDPDDREITGLGTAAGEDDAARLRADERGDFVAGLFNRAARVARGPVTPGGIANDTALPRRHGVGDLVATWRGGGVIEVVLTHAT